MAISDKTDLVVQTYSRNSFPVLEEGLKRYFQEELQRIEIAITSLAQAATQVTDSEPEAPVKGMIRFAASPWDPLGTGFEGLVVYDGSAWSAV